MHFEEGFSRPSFDRLRRLANALEVSTDYLLGIVVAPELEIGDALYRAVGQLTDEDRELAKNFLKVLVENTHLRRRKKKAIVPSECAHANRGLP
jgi:transcriptional regulator with XRE-family HTH domain